MNKQNGFTFIELVTVMAIIGIMVAVGIPEYNRYQAHSKRSEGISHLHLVKIAQATIYAEQNQYVYTQAAIMQTFPPDRTPKFYLKLNLIAKPQQKNNNEGYVATVEGDIDHDGLPDILALRVGDAGEPFNTLVPLGISIYDDDLKY